MKEAMLKKMLNQFPLVPNRLKTKELMESRDLIIKGEELRLLLEIILIGLIILRLDLLLK